MKQARQRKTNIASKNVILTVAESEMMVACQGLEDLENAQRL